MTHPPGTGSSDPMLAALTYSFTVGPPTTRVSPSVGACGSAITSHLVRNSAKAIPPNPCKSFKPPRPARMVKQKRTKPCSAMLDVIQPMPPYGIGDPYSPLDLSPLLVLLMIRLNDDADDDGIIDDFCESFHLNRRAVVAAIKAYRHASRTVH